MFFSYLLRIYDLITLALIQWKKNSLSDFNHNLGLTFFYAPSTAMELLIFMELRLHLHVTILQDYSLLYNVYCSFSRLYISFSLCLN